LESKRDTTKPSPTGRIQSFKSEPYHTGTTYRLPEGIRGKRANLCIMDDMAIEGRNYANIERRVLAYMVEILGTSITASDLKERFRDFGFPEAAQRRPTSKVPNAEFISAAGSVLQHTEQSQFGGKRTLVRSGNRGRRPELHKGRRVRSDSKPIRYGTWTGQARESISSFADVTATGISMVGPGSSGNSRYEQGYEFVKSYGYTGTLDDFIRLHGGSKEPEQPRYNKDSS
jgi:hypothetical protein